MLKSVRKHLDNLLWAQSDTSNDDPVKTARLAAAALLIEAAQADFGVSDTEMLQVKHALVSSFGIAPSDIEQTLRNARTELQQATCLHELIRLINDNWDEERKIRLIEAMWSVVLSDEHLDSNEHHLMRKVKGLLYISQSEYIAAKLRARQSLKSQLDSD